MKSFCNTHQPTNTGIYLAAESWTPSRRFRSGNTKSSHHRTAASLSRSHLSTRGTMYERRQCCVSEMGHFSKWPQDGLTVQTHVRVQVVTSVLKAGWPTQSCVLKIAIEITIKKWQLFCCSPETYQLIWKIINNNIGIESSVEEN